MINADLKTLLFSEKVFFQAKMPGLPVGSGPQGTGTPGCRTSGLGWPPTF